jgi:hypothetical protein
VFFINLSSDRGTKILKELSDILAELYTPNSKSLMGIFIKNSHRYLKLKNISEKS